MSYFNSHPHEEDDLPAVVSDRWKEHFNSHPHEEDDEKEEQRDLNNLEFQLTSSRRG